jgi:putative FmdB family regulatory protein
MEAEPPGTLSQTASGVQKLYFCPAGTAKMKFLHSGQSVNLTAVRQRLGTRSDTNFIQEEIIMPLFDFLCLDCGKVSEILVFSDSDSQQKCQGCGGSNLKKMLAAHSSLSGTARSGLPGPGDTACCGSNPTHAGCAGPGSCCGKGPF